MAFNSKIEWTEVTWNPVTGCTKISSGCANCYAERLALRLQAMGQARYRAGFELAIHPDVIKQPLRWKASRIVFVNSMSDLFHEGVPELVIKRIFSVMNATPQHIYQILTKRSERLAKLAAKLTWSPNIWMGVTVESQKYLYRADHLRRVPAAVRFLSLEPLLGSIKNLDLKNIDWVIAGGESGPCARKMEKSWVLEIKEKCLRHRIPFFFKQWGGINKKKNGRTLDGKKWSQMPSSHEMSLF